MIRIAIFFLLLFSGCEKKPVSIQGVAHTHAYHLQVGHFLSEKEKKEICNLVAAVFTEIDETYNHWNPHSELSRNLYTPKVKAILSLAHTFYELTDGWYDPTLGELIHNFKTKGELPIKSKNLSFGFISFIENNKASILLDKKLENLSSIFYKNKENKLKAQIKNVVYDLDGMLKGFTIDLILKKLVEKGYKNLYMEWGGEVATRGYHPQGRPWRVLVNEKPLDLVNAALATSGSLEQLWTVEKRVLTHIIDPHLVEMLEVKSGQAHTVSVKAPSGALADALATACMACGSLEKAYAFAKKIKKQYPEIEFWITSYEL